MLFAGLTVENVVNLVALHAGSKVIMGGISFAIAQTVRKERVVYVHYIACNDASRLVQLKMGQETTQNQVRLPMVCINWG